MKQFWTTALYDGVPLKEMIQKSKERMIYDKKVNSIINLNPNLNEELRTLDKNSVLKGIPILIKDCFQTKNWVTSAGSKLYINNVPKKDAEIIKRIKKSGGLILGKTNLPKMSLDIQTISEIHGLTRNPYDLELTPGGSSGGSAAAVCLGIVPIALCSDLSGSGRIPASFCGVYSLRPTTYRIPTEGCFPKIEWKDVETLVSLGAIAQDIDYLQIFMKAVCNDFRNVKLNLNEKLRIGFTTCIKDISTDNRIIKLNESTLNQLKTFQEVECQSFNPNLDVKEMQMAYSHLAVIMENKSEKYTNALNLLKKYRKIVDEFFDKFDVWILPCSNVLPYEHNFDKTPIKIQNEFGEIKYWKTQSYTSILSLVGNPIVVMPIGMIGHVPVGIQVVGRRNEDELLLERCKILQKIFSKNVNEPNYQNLIDSKL